LAYHAVFNHVIQSARLIIAVSRSTKQQILDRYAINPDKIKVVYEGFKSIYKMMDKEEAFKVVAQKFGITKPFILYVGVWRRYKNLAQLSRAFDQLKEQGLDIELVLAGEPDKFYPEIEQEVRGIKNRQSLITPGRVSDEDLNLLYNAATLFVLPSMMEGFGLTALEAAACGVPVACSDIPTLREVMGQGAVYFDPENLENTVDVLKGLVTNPKALEDLANLSLSRSKHFSWKEAGSQTIAVYQEAIK
jgi:glycosyltransferase involved in cell wall biosynthesis